MLKRILLIVLSLSLILSLFASCSAEEKEELKQPYYDTTPVYGAHIPENTTPLETDKFLDPPDFILFTQCGETVQLSPELQAAVYAEFEAIMQTAVFAFYSILGPIPISTTINKMQTGGAVRFCYRQRRYFTGMFSGEYYEWGHLMFDEVIIDVDCILFGLDGRYKSVGSYGDYLTFYKGEADRVSFYSLCVLAKEALP